MQFKTFFFIFLFALGNFCCSEKESIHPNTVQHINNILEQNIKIQKERFPQIEREIIEDLSNPIKFKYSFLLKAAGKALWAYKDFYELKKEELDDSNFSERENFLSQMNFELSKIDSSIITLFDSCLTTEYKTIGLYKHEMEARLKGIRNEYSELQKKLISRFEEDIMDDEVFQIYLNSLAYAAIHKAHFFIKKFRELTGGKSYRPNKIFPLIQPKSNCIKKGEYFEAEVFIGDFYRFYPIEKPRIIINGDTLVFEKDKVFAKYKVKVTERGEMDLNIECMIQNILTGDNYKGFTNHTITVD